MSAWEFAYSTLLSTIRDCNLWYTVAELAGDQAAYLTAEVAS
jgi:hypothetical protein